MGRDTFTPISHTAVTKGTRVLLLVLGNRSRAQGMECSKEVKKPEGGIKDIVIDRVIKYRNSVGIVIYGQAAGGRGVFLLGC
jgi:hypothetical protein